MSWSAQVPWSEVDEEAVRGLFRDVNSRQIFDRRIDYVRTGDFALINDIVRENTEGLPLLYSEEQRVRFVRDVTSQLDATSRIFVYGAGAVGSMTLALLGEEIDVHAFIDVKAELQDSGFRGHAVLAPEAVPAPSESDVLVVALWDNYYSTMIPRFEAAGWQRSRIFPVMNYLNPTWLPNMYFDVDLEPMSGIFVDLGAYDLGDSVTFARSFPNGSGGVAFEPDTDCFARCLEVKREKRLDDVDVVPFGAWSSETTLSFNSFANGASSIVRDGTTSINVTTVDEVVGGRKVGMIKMDIEGAEEEAIRGAATVIRRDRPALAISIYHKASDLVRLPLLVYSLCPDYEFSLRAYSNTLVDTVLFAR